MELTFKTVAALVVVSFIGGLVAAASSGYGPLAAISFNVIPGNATTTTSSSGEFVTQPFLLDLGNLTAGEAGSFNGTAQITVPYDAMVKFELENEDILEYVFSQFIVTVSVGNETFVLDLYSVDEVYVFLPAGTYDVFVTVDFVVKPDASGSFSNVVFLKAELEDDSSTTTTTSSFDNDYDDEEDDE